MLILYPSLKRVPYLRSIIKKVSLIKCITAFLGFLLILIFINRLFMSIFVYGHSMKPTIFAGDYIVCLKVMRGSGFFGHLVRSLLIKRGVTVVAKPPFHSGKLVVKRVEGLSGDYRQWGWSNLSSGFRIVPKNQIFLVGDASSNEMLDDITFPPIDSRLYGPCPIECVVAICLIRIWPLKRFSWLS